jgi:hypothetical protein
MRLHPFKDRIGAPMLHSAVNQPPTMSQLHPPRRSQRGACLQAAWNRV